MTAWCHRNIRIRNNTFEDNAAEDGNLQLHEEIFIPSLGRDNQDKTKYYVRNN